MSKEKTLRDRVNTVGRYTLGSFLPKEVQKKMAREHGEEADDYLFGTLFTDVAVSGALIVGGIASGCIPLAVAGTGAFGHTVIDLCRLFGAMKDDSFRNAAAWGHPVITVPYHLFYKQPSNLLKYLDRKLSAEGKGALELYTNEPWKFKKRFKSLSEEEQKGLLARIIVAEEKNNKLDSWLSEKYPKTVGELLYAERKKERELEERERKKKPEEPMEDVWKALTGGKNE